MDVDTTTATTTPLDIVVVDDVNATATTSLDSLKTSTSTLPPRKRAKTQEEKEQRKIERILRNRRAAHASREKKRRHVEYLEVYVVKLEENLHKIATGYQQLLEKLPTEEDQVSIEDLGLENLSELKSQIHSNLNGSRRGGNNSSRKGSQVEEEEEEDHDEDDVEGELDQSHEHDSTPVVEVKVEKLPQSPPSKKRKYSPQMETTTTTPPTSTRSSSITSSPAHAKLEAGEEEEEEEQQQQQQDCNNKNYTHSLQPPQAMNEKTFYNYLSPISLHSSASSPMDFTLNSKSDFNDFTFEEVKQQLQQQTQEQESMGNFSQNTLKDVPTQSQPSSSTEVSTQESNLSIYELGQNSAVILSIEEEKQQPQHTLVEILEKENKIRLAISV